MSKSVSARWIMGKIKLIGVDLDGTVLDSKRQISIENIEVFAECKSRGIHIVPVTGRPYSGLFDEYKNAINCDYSIHTNGAVVINVRSGERVISHSIAQSKAIELMGILSEFDCHYGIFHNNYGYLGARDYALELEKYKGTPLHRYVLKTRRPVESQHKFIRTINSCDNIYVIANSTSERERIRKAIENVEDIFYTCSEDVDVEIGGKCSKGSTLIEFGQMLGIDRSEIMAIGDSGNDLSMLEDAGISVAMENAGDSIKNAADFVTKSCDESGVAHAIKTLVL